MSNPTIGHPDGRPFWRAGLWIVLAIAGVALHEPCVAANAADSLRIATHRRAVLADSIAVATAARLERTPGVDSLVLARAWWDVAWMRQELSAATDSLAIAAATRSLGVRQRHLPEHDVEVAAAHEVVAEAIDNGEVQQARKHIERAIEIRTQNPAPDDSILAVDWRKLGTYQDMLDDSPAALAALERALAIQERLWGREHREISATHFRIGLAHENAGRTEAARESYVRALEVATRVGGPDDLYRTGPLARLAGLLEASGDMNGRLRLFQEALRVTVVATGENSGQTATTRSNLANKLMDFGDFAGARIVFEQVIPNLEADLGSDHVYTMLARQSLASAYCVLGDAARARPLLAQVEARWRQKRPGDPGHGLGTALRWQAELLQREKRFAEAAAMAQQAIDEEERGPRPASWSLGRSYAVRIHALEALDDSAASNAAARGLAALQKSGNLSPKANVLASYWRARALRRPGSEAAAFELALAADSVARTALQFQVRTLPDRRALQLSRQRADILELVVEIAATDLGPEFRAIAWDRVVRMRGLVRSELESRRLAPELRADSSLTRLHSGWVAAQQRLARVLVETRAAPDAAARERVEALQRAADEAEVEYVRALAARGGAAPPKHDPTLADVRGRLEPGQALISFLEYKARDDSSRVVAFVCRGGDDRIDLVSFGGSSELRGTIDSWRRKLATLPPSEPGARRRAERDCRRAGSVLRTRVWEPLAAHLGTATEVLVVPDGPVLEFPWQALPDGPDGYLVENGLLVRVVSAERDLLARPHAFERSRTRSLLAVGAPDYDRGGARVHDATAPFAVRGGVGDICAQPERLRLSPLPEAALEVESIARRWRSRPQSTATVLAGVEASESNLKSNAAGHSILHIATHGVVVGDTCTAVVGASRGVGGLGPLAKPGKRKRPDAQIAESDAPPSPWMGVRVWLALAGANRAASDAGDEEDGLLTAEEVVALDIGGTDWVVLSACHSALAETWSREGATGMRRAFELAGAQSVIASHWPVEDRATREWMEALYAARAEGITRAAPAVQTASRAVLAARRRDDRSTHPFYWAAFSASGR